MDGRSPFTVMDPGEGRGGPGTPLFLDQTEAQRAEKYFLETGSPSLPQGLDDQPPPLILRSGSSTALCGDPRLFWVDSLLTLRGDTCLGFSS